MKNIGRLHEERYYSPTIYIGAVQIERGIGEGTEVYGEVINSVIGAGVTIGEGAVIRDSIIMKGTTIAGTVVDKAIVAEDVTIGEKC